MRFSVYAIASVLFGLVVFFSASGGYETSMGTRLTEGEATVLAAVFIMSGIILAALGVLMVTLEDMISSIVPPSQTEPKETNGTNTSQP